MEPYQKLDEDTDDVKVLEDFAAQPSQIYADDPPLDFHVQQAPDHTTQAYASVAEAQPPYAAQQAHGFEPVPNYSYQQQGYSIKPAQATTGQQAASYPEQAPVGYSGQPGVGCPGQPGTYSALPPSYTYSPVQSQGNAQVITIQPQQMAVSGSKRMHAQSRHGWYVGTSYALLCCSVYCCFCGIPFGLVAFICALVSLYKQEKSKESASNVLGIVSVGFTIAGVVSIVIGIIVYFVAFSSVERDEMNPYMD